MTIGPQLPPHLAALAQPSAAPPPAATEEDSDDDYGPSLPPDLADERSTAPSIGPSLPPAVPPVAGPSKPSIGPSLPPHLSSSSSSRPPSADPSLRPSYPHRPLPAEDDSDDDSFGPMPLPAGASSYDSHHNDAVAQFREREERQAEKERKEREGEGKLKREEWMLVPPKEMDLLSSIDTTKLKSRGFATGKAAQQLSNKSEPSNLWTETPAERQQRLADEMLGKKRKAEGPVQEEETDEERRKRERDRMLREEVERHNASSRGTSLVDAHTKTSKKKKKENGGEDDRAPTAIWDRERDMSLGGRLMDDSKRNDVIRNAKGLGGRFSGGGYM